MPFGTADPQLLATVFAGRQWVIVLYYCLNYGLRLDDRER